MKLSINDIVELVKAEKENTLNAEIQKLQDQIDELQNKYNEAVTGRGSAAKQKIKDRFPKLFAELGKVIRCGDSYASIHEVEFDIEVRFKDTDEERRERQTRHSKFMDTLNPLQREQSNLYNKRESLPKQNAQIKLAILTDGDYSETSKAYIQKLANKI